ncbi:hypothetical protein SLEP1_g44015 [Rubroshorea leprosula]|uniref:ENT domain-containing protein n=1 Tax=Rubroshorea leprosula TaxID=152421 RepID=A0AAV5LEW2_9ROSI|nr:hypothetical protein SLEP1_g44015 [Rubroshorea leprosula]
MRFRKGSKVEVLSTAEAATASWFCAEIISGNGHTYSVKYGWSPAMERVPRKAIRPCPPPLEGAADWVPGDLVEVFVNPAWKTAVVVEVLGGNGFSVRLVGSKTEFRVPKSHLRSRQCWKDGRWFLIGKGSGNSTVSKVTRQIEAAMEPYVGADGTRKSPMISEGALKRRSSPCLSDAETEYHAVAKKIRLIVKDSTGARSLLLHPSPFSEKVDALVTQQKLLGEKDMHASFHDRTTMWTGMDVSSENNRIDIDIHSCASSVGSCSSEGYDIDRLPFGFRTYHTEKNVDDYSSDAESGCGDRYGEGACSLSTNVELRTDIHRSELHAYRRAIQALYASGPLSWEDEIKMTNLRSRLHISTDEHLTELKNLKYNQTGPSLCCY